MNNFTHLDNDIPDFSTRTINGKRHYIIPQEGGDIAYPSITSILGWFSEKDYKSGEEGLAKKKQTKCRSKRPEGAQTYTKSLKTTSPIKVTIKVI